MPRRAPFPGGTGTRSWTGRGAPCRRRRTRSRCGFRRRGVPAHRRPIRALLRELPLVVDGDRRPGNDNEDLVARLALEGEDGALVHGCRRGQRADPPQFLPRAIGDQSDTLEQGHPLVLGETTGRHGIALPVGHDDEWMGRGQIEAVMDPMRSLAGLPGRQRLHQGDRHCPSGANAATRVPQLS